MNTSLVITLLGPDRPGLVSALAKSAGDCGANWMESSMAQLAGKFAGIVRLEIDSAEVGKLKAALQGLESEGLRLSIEEAEAPKAAKAGRVTRLELVGQDRPGIVREISSVLARHGASIDRLESACESASFSGEALFRAQITVHVPAAAEVEKLQQEIEALANELMVDVTMGDDTQH